MRLRIASPPSLNKTRATSSQPFSCLVRRSSQSAPRSSVKCASSVTRATLTPRCLATRVRTSLGARTSVIAWSLGVTLPIVMIRPEFVEYVGMRPSNPPHNVASFKNAESVATAPQLRAPRVSWRRRPRAMGVLSASHDGSQSVPYLKSFRLRRRFAARRARLASSPEIAAYCRSLEFRWLRLAKRAQETGGILSHHSGSNCLNRRLHAVVIDPYGGL